ncbi:MAG: DUF58 domain-containing protein [Oscillospiraceae bacterium]|nr:DUF58 domain-containing protein [Oscillospiraceae bacterium]
MAGRRALYLAALAGCLVFYVFYQKWFSWIVLLAVAGLPWLSLLLSLPAMVTYRLEPEAPAGLKTGGRAKLRIRGVCSMPHPPAKVKLRLTRPITGESWVLKPGAYLPTGHCGGLVIQPVRAGVYDYLGLFRRKLRKIDAATAIVWPAPLKMKVPPDLSRYLARSWRPKFGGGYAENHELRLYRPGDGLNQVHWKLSAKTGKLIIREAMEPERGLVLLTMDLCGTAEELDRKFGRLLWLGNYLLERGIPFQLRALTGEGPEVWPVAGEQDLRKAAAALLCREPAVSGSIRDRSVAASWQYHIGGDPDEA